MSGKRWFLSLIALLIVGCAPVISQEALKEVDEDLPFQAVLRNPEGLRGKTVLLGGEIIETTPLPGKTRMTVLQHPLGHRDRPSIDERSEGRFIVEVEDFLDPAIYTQGRQVTVAGIIEGKEVKPVGEISYTYPLVKGREIYLWPMEDPMVIPQFYFGIGVGKTF